MRWLDVLRELGIVEKISEGYVDGSGYRCITGYHYEFSRHNEVPKEIEADVASILKKVMDKATKADEDAPVKWSELNKEL